MSSRIINRLDRQVEALEIMADNAGYDIENDEHYRNLMEMLRDVIIDEDNGTGYSFDISAWLEDIGELKYNIKNF